MGVRERLGGGDPIMQYVANRKLAVGGALDQVVEGAAGHVLGDDVRLAIVLAKIKHGDDVGMAAQPSHGLGLTQDAAAAVLVEAVDLDHGDRNFTIEARVLGELDLLAASFTEELAHLVAAVHQGLG